MVGSKHTQVRCGEKNPNLFTSLLNKAALSVRLISNMFRFGAFFFVFFFVRSVLLFSDSLQFFAPPFFLGYGWGVSPGNTKKERKKERKNEIN